MLFLSQYKVIDSTEHSQPSGTFFYHDTVLVQLVTLWADLPLVCEVCKQTGWKIYPGTTQFFMCFANSDPEKTEFSLSTHKALHLARLVTSVSLWYIGQRFKQKETSVSHRSTSYFTESEPRAACRSALTSGRLKDTGKLGIFLNSLFFSPQLENSPHTAACTARFPDFTQSST